MKKFYWLLLFIGLFSGCTNKADIVIKKLENNSSLYTKLQKENLSLFCSDIDEMLDLQEKNSLFLLLSGSEVKRKEKFKTEYGNYIKKHTVEESVQFLRTPYHVSDLNTLRINNLRIQSFLKNITTPPIKESVINYKIANLQLILRRNTSITLEPYYSPERAEILNNNNLEWQKKKNKEIIAGIVKQMSKIRSRK